MASETKLTFAPDYAFPPGDTIAEVLESRGMSQRELAERTGLTPKTVNEIVKGKASVSADTAVQLERALGLPASFWSNLQGRYDEWRVKQAESERLVEWRAWADRFPLRHMAKWKWCDLPDTAVGRVRALLNYFGTATPELWETQWRQCQVAFRSAAKKADQYALACWLRQGEIQAARIETAPYEHKRFRAALVAARALSRCEGVGFVDPLVTKCAESGVAVVFTPELPGVRAYGATRWLTAQKALVQLSLRQKSEDHLWFTFFHEAAHILLHPKKVVFLEHENGHDDLEDEANEFAGVWLIPEDLYQAFLEQGDLSEAAVEAFAERIGIAPGVVVGRMQHDRVVGFNKLNGLKKRYSFEEPPSA